MFRKNINDIMGKGGLFETAREVYPHLGAEEKFSARKFVFPSGATVNFDHLDNEAKSVIDDRFRGLQMPAIYVDECTQVKFSTIMKLITSNRNGHGIRNRIHCSCNPDSSSWLRKFIEWYIDEDGHIIKERDGVIRYFFLAGETVDDVIWGCTREEVYEKAKTQIDKAWNPAFEKEFGMTKYSLIKDMTFIEGDLLENRKLMEADPTYIANIAQGTDEDRARNIEGNWNISLVAGEEMVTRDILEKKMFDNAEQRTGRRRLSVDVAVQGADNCIMVGWDGLHIDRLDSYPKFSDDEAIKSAVRRTMESQRVLDSDLYYDAVGNGVCLSSLGGYGVQAKAAALNEGAFGTLKDQIMWTLGDLIIKGKISIDETLLYKKIEYGKKGKVTIRDIIIEEMKVLKIVDSDGKIKMANKSMMKKELGHSPDLLEGIAYGVTWTLLIKKGKSKKKGIYNL